MNKNLTDGYHRGTYNSKNLHYYIVKVNGDTSYWISITSAGKPNSFGKCPTPTFSHEHYTFLNASEMDKVYIELAIRADKFVSPPLGWVFKEVEDKVINDYPIC